MFLAITKQIEQIPNIFRPGVATGFSKGGGGVKRGELGVYK
jgi:hypothetical protein